MVSVVIPGLVLENEWIPPLRYENNLVSSLTSALLESKDILFPDYFLVEFDLLLGPPDEDQVQANLALVDRECKSWCLLYICPSGSTDLSELEHKIETTGRNEFGVREALDLQRNIDSFTKEQLIYLVNSDDPKLIVITDDPHHGWFKKIPDLDLNVMVVEVFLKEEKGAIRVNGMYPLIQNQKLIAFAWRHIIIPHTLELDRPLPSPLNARAQIRLRHKENTSQWKLVNTPGAMLLTTTDYYELPNSNKYKIMQEPDGTLLIQPDKEK